MRKRVTPGTHEMQGELRQKQNVQMVCRSQVVVLLVAWLDDRNDTISNKNIELLCLIDNKLVS